MGGRRTVRRAGAAGAALLALVGLGAVPAVAAGPAGPRAVDDAPAYAEQYRPQYHFTPAKNWMNDPNGLIFYKGEYHLFFQHNPNASTWGDISWGHAVSRDLVHWTELPLAIPATAQEMAWSGSVVVDTRNTSGFGTPGNPAMVAIYTAYDRVTRDQRQSLAYSLDRGRTWTRYAGNPVLDDPDPDFRDPKVFWHAATKRWVMVTVLGAQRRVAFHASRDLKAWTPLSTFGPANAVGGVWEVPDLFPLPVDGRPGRTRWVLKVGINPGAVAGGSGDQYFVGSFDGTRFRADRIVDPAPPRGTVLADFEAADFGAWTVEGSAFGAAPSKGALPAEGTVPAQSAVVGYRGAGLANSRHGGDAATGSLTSPPFTITKPFLNMLVGGAAAPPGAALGASPAAVELLVDGVVVRSASGTNGEGLDWRSWDVRKLVGSTAVLRAVDRGTASGQHLLLDHVMASARPARSVRERSDWVDWGKDFYAAVTWEGVPDGRRLMIGWTSNWQYAQTVPTAPWRSAQSLVRELSLRTIGGRPQLVQRPVASLASLRRGPVYELRDAALPPGTRTLAGPGTRGNTLEIDARFDVRRASDVGLHVLAGPAGSGRRTVIGYDAVRREVYVDRRASGVTAFSPTFASDVQRAPLAAPGGRVRLRVFVDASSVEVFAQDGRRVLTDLVFPASPQDDHVAVFAAGGRARIDSLRITRLASAVPRG